MLKIITFFIPEHTILLTKFKNYERNIMKEHSFDQYYDQFPVAMAYVPWQHFQQMCENPETAYQEGTIFPDLNKPFKGRRCV